MTLVTIVVIAAGVAIALVMRVVAFIVVAGVVISITLPVAIIATTVPFDGLLIAVVTTPVLPMDWLGPGMMVIGPASRAVTTAGGNIQNLPSINVIWIGQTIGAGNLIGVHPKFSANGKEGIAITDSVVKTAAPTAAVAITTVPLRLTIGGNGYL